MARKLSLQERESINYITDVLCHALPAAQRSFAGSLASALVRVKGDQVTDADLVRATEKFGEYQSALIEVAKAKVLDRVPAVDAKGDGEAFTLRVPESLGEAASEPEDAAVEASAAGEKPAEPSAEAAAEPAEKKPARRRRTRRKKAAEPEGEAEVAKAAAAEVEAALVAEPEPQAEPEVKPAPQPLPNKFRPEKPAAKPEVKPERKPEKPPVKKPEPYRPAPAKPKKKAPDAQRQSHKAGVLLTVLIICAAVLAVLLLRSLGVFGTPSAAETTPTPAPTAPVETAVPTETPTPTPTPKPEPTYEVVKADVSWADAEAAAEAKGGHLVVIDSAEKWTRVAQLADESGLTYVWIGLYRADSGELAWVKDNIDPVYNWAAGEPSVRDTNGAAENYVLIARRSDGWYYNDCIGDPAAKYPQFYGGKTGYIIEIDP